MEMKKHHKHPPHHHRPPHEWHSMVDTPEAVEVKREEVEAAVSVLLEGDSNHAGRICRLALNHGPWERYETNTALSAALLAAVIPNSDSLPEYSGPYEEVELHLPPHLGGHRGKSFARLKMPTRLLRDAFGSDEAVEYVVDALSEGPHHDVAGNIMLLSLIEAMADLIRANTTSQEENDEEC